MEKQGNYYNSDLNEYIGKNLPNVMTSIDCDLFQLKMYRKILRFGEYKHKNEKIGDRQLEALKQIAAIAKVVNLHKSLFNGWTMQVVIIRGNPPFNAIEVTDLITDKKYNLSDKKKIDDFLMLNKL